MANLIIGYSKIIFIKGDKKKRVEDVMRCRRKLWVVKERAQKKNYKMLSYWARVQ